MKKQIICIVCPRGCLMEAAVDGSTVAVIGNGCKRGLDHAVGECTNPLRTVTSTVRLENRDTMVPVKTLAPIPKGKMFAAMERIRAARVNAPVHIGDVLIAGVFGTDIVATGEVL